MGISTHTSRVGCDGTLLDGYAVMPISTHTSRVGCDFNRYKYIVHYFEFLLTHPVWDVTLFAVSVTPETAISTHTSRVGCDRYI